MVSSRSTRRAPRSSLEFSLPNASAAAAPNPLEAPVMRTHLLARFVGIPASYPNGGGNVKRNPPFVVSRPPPQIDAKRCERRAPSPAITGCTGGEGPRQIFVAYARKFASLRATQSFQTHDQSFLGAVVRGKLSVRNGDAGKPSRLNRFTT